MAVHVYWFLLALILVGLEMATGTFYLLMVGVALAIGGFSALLGLAFWVQFALAALAGIAGIVLLLHWKRSHISDVRLLSLDIGQPVEVLAWRDGGTARVFYRGAEWDAELETLDSVRNQPLYIKDIRGSVLVLTNRNTI